MSHGHQLPNLLSFWKPPSKLHNGFKCGQCRKTECYDHLENEPYSGSTLVKEFAKKNIHFVNYLGLMIPVEIDTALEDFFERLLQEYVYFWYSEISYDEDFVQEIRYEIK